jgi:hypothetical protein
VLEVKGDIALVVGPDSHGSYLHQVAVAAWHPVEVVMAQGHVLL